MVLNTIVVILAIVLLGSWIAGQTRKSIRIQQEAEALVGIKGTGGWGWSWHLFDGYGRRYQPYVYHGTGCRKSRYR